MQGGGKVVVVLGVVQCGVVWSSAVLRLTFKVDSGVTFLGRQ